MVGFALNAGGSLLDSTAFQRPCNLSTLGQNLKTSTMGWEICFAVVIFICGLVLFSFVIGIIQETMLSMLSSKITTEKTKMKLLQDVEHWMETRLLPDDLKERVRQYQQLKWERNQVLDVDNLLNNLPSNLRKDVIHHLCMTSIRKVPMFEQMDEQLVDALCERLNQAVYTEKIYIIREGDPVHEMLFVVRGNLLTTSSDNGRPGFFNYQYLMAGDFCGEELQMWILDPNSSSNLPISLRTVRTLTEVEAFSLKVDDFKFITSRLLPHSQQYRQNFRFYSQQWRTWAACFIQAAWRYRKRKLEKAIHEEENKLQNALANSSGGAPSLGAAIYASRFAANALRAIRRTGYRQVRLVENVPLMLVRKPAEPDFTDEERLL